MKITKNNLIEEQYYCYNCLGTTSNVEDTKYNGKDAKKCCDCGAIVRRCG